MCLPGHRPGTFSRREKDGGGQAPAASPMCAPHSLVAFVDPLRVGLARGPSMEETELLREGECPGSPGGTGSALGLMWTQGVLWVSRGHGEHPGSHADTGSALGLPGAGGALWVSCGHRPGHPVYL